MNKEKELRKVYLAPGYGYAVFPLDWPILNPDEAEKAKYVYCGRSMNAERYGVPSIVIYYSPVSYWDVPARDAECNRMDSLFTQFSETCMDAFLNHQVQEKRVIDENGERVFVNKDEWAESFVLFHEELPVIGAKLPFCDSGVYNFKYDAHVVRPEGYDYADEDRVAGVSEENEWKGMYL